MGNSLLKPCHIWSAHSPPAAPSLACGWHWSLNKLTNWPFTTPSLRCSKAALMITQPDTVTGAAEQSLTPPALPFYPHTYCSLFVALIHKHHRGLVTVPQCNSTCSPCLSDYLFPLCLSCRANKAWSRLWDGNQELNISAFIKLSVIERGVHTHKVHTANKDGRACKTRWLFPRGADGRVWGKTDWEKRAKQMKGRWNVKRQVVGRMVIVGLKVYQHRHPQHSSNHTFNKIWKSCYLWEKGRGEGKCTPRRCEEMPLQFLTYTVLSQGHWSAGKIL